MEKIDLSINALWGDGSTQYTPSASLEEIFWKEVGRVKDENPDITEDDIRNIIEAHKDCMSDILLGITALISISLKSHLLQLTKTSSGGWDLISQAIDLIAGVAQEVKNEKERRQK